MQLSAREANCLFVWPFVKKDKNKILVALRCGNRDSKRDERDQFGSTYY